MPQSHKLPPGIDADLPAVPYDENQGLAQRSRDLKDQHEQSGNLPDSSDPVRSDRPFRLNE